MPTFPITKPATIFLGCEKKSWRVFQICHMLPTTQDCTGQSQTLLKLHMKKENCSRFSNNGQSWPVLISLEVVFGQIIGYVTGPWDLSAYQIWTRSEGGPQPPFGELAWNDPFNLLSTACPYRHLNPIRLMRNLPPRWMRTCSMSISQMLSSFH